MVRNKTLRRSQAVCYRRLSMREIIASLYRPSQTLISSARVEVNWPRASNHPKIISLSAARIQCLKTAGTILPHGRAAAFAVVFVGHQMYAIPRLLASDDIAHDFAAGQLPDLLGSASQLTNIRLHHPLLIVVVAYGDSEVRHFVVDARTRNQYRLEKSAWNEVVRAFWK
ncbi:hypothetical protein PAXRUDRAFT_36993 [Paxillus rubicundulus Ve08.2h10]|uniref:Uncharacterized protein n=1 Tax=Paxillus rubicundulus Ve08.2h10 TaxID=930991 RepID=A0A0D0DD59_9AGAM|nr:hypothetical protein PAXRUDRAFT_36993 [Paxillus rubicundulus Ve08.2h10]